MKKKICAILITALLTAGISGCSNGLDISNGEEAPTTPEIIIISSTPAIAPTITSAPTPTDVPVDIPVDTPTPTPTLAPTDTPTPEPTATNTPVPTATNTPKPTATSTPVPTATNTPVPTATNTPVPTATNTPTPTATNTPIPTATGTPTPTATNTPKPTATSTPTPTSDPSLFISGILSTAAGDSEKPSEISWTNPRKASVGETVKLYLELGSNNGGKTYYTGGTVPTGKIGEVLANTYDVYTTTDGFSITFTFKSSNNNVCVINDRGILSCYSAGSVNITVGYTVTNRYGQIIQVGESIVPLTVSAARKATSISFDEGQNLSFLNGGDYTSEQLKFTVRDQYGDPYSCGVILKISNGNTIEPFEFCSVSNGKGYVDFDAAGRAAGYYRLYATFTDDQSFETPLGSISVVDCTNAVATAESSIYTSTSKIDLNNLTENSYSIPEATISTVQYYQGLRYRRVPYILNTTVTTTPNYTAGRELELPGSYNVGDTVYIMTVTNSKGENVFLQSKYTPYISYDQSTGNITMTVSNANNLILTGDNANVMPSDVYTFRLDKAAAVNTANGVKLRYVSDFKTTVTVNTAVSMPTIKLNTRSLTTSLSFEDALLSMIDSVYLPYNGKALMDGKRNQSITITDKTYIRNSIAEMRMYSGATFNVSDYNYIYYYEKYYINSIPIRVYLNEFLSYTTDVNVNVNGESVMIIPTR